MSGVRQAKQSEVKGIIKGHKTFCLSVYGWEGVCLSVSLSACL